MKPQILKTLFLASACIASSAFGASIDQVIVRQQWPWSTDIVVEYMLSGVTSPVDIEVEAYSGDVKLNSDVLRNAITGDRYALTKNGPGEFTIDPVKVFGTANVVLPNFRVKLTVSDSPANADEVLYKIFDLKDGSCTDVTRTELLNGKYGSIVTDFGNIGEGYNTSLEDVLIWTGVTNNIEYRTSKLVMRKIPAKNVETKIGSYECQSLTNVNNALRTVSFTNDYYMGVFELTYGQALSLYTNTPGSTVWNTKITMRFTNTVDQYERPMNMSDTFSRNMVSRWPGDASFKKGPFSNNNSTVVGNVRKQTGILGFDLPTEAVWEYACRAGTTNDFNSGLNFTTESDIALLGRTSLESQTGSPSPADSIYYLTSAEGGSAIVGSYRPNAWGLYDMHGNIMEMCLDRYVDDVTGFTGDDPWGPELPEGVDKDFYRVGRGGAFYLKGNACYSSVRTNMYGNNSNTSYIGIRLCLTIY